MWSATVISVERLPDCFEGWARPTTARRRDGVSARNIYGVQFHPEVTLASSASASSRISFAASVEALRIGVPSSAETIEAIKADIRARVGPTNTCCFS